MNKKLTGRSCLSSGENKNKKLELCFKLIYIKISGQANFDLSNCRNNYIWLLNSIFSVVSCVFSLFYYTFDFWLLELCVWTLQLFILLQWDTLYLTNFYHTVMWRSEYYKKLIADYYFFLKHPTPKYTKEIHSK